MRRGTQWGLDSETPEDWRRRAACASDPDRQFPNDNAREALAAKVVCASCPVVEPCLKWAMETDEPFGVWGGLTERERKRAKVCGWQSCSRCGGAFVALVSNQRRCAVCAWVAGKRAKR